MFALSGAWGDVVTYSVSKGSYRSKWEIIGVHVPSIVVIWEVLVLVLVLGILSYREEGATEAIGGLYTDVAIFNRCQR